jgi:hypothetical protein
MRRSLILVLVVALAALVFAPAAFAAIYQTVSRRLILRRSSVEGSRNSSSRQEPLCFQKAFLTRPSPAHSRLPQRQPCQRRRYQCRGRNSPLMTLAYLS